MKRDRRRVGSIMLWGCFSASGSTNLVKMQVIANKEKCVEILKGNSKQSLQDHLTFQHDSDPKHTSLLVRKMNDESNGLHKALICFQLKLAWGELKKYIHA